MYTIDSQEIEADQPTKEEIGILAIKKIQV